MKKELTINQLAKEVFVSNVTLRTWLMKPIVGQAYDPDQLNYKNLETKLTQLYPDFEERFKFKIEDIQILRREKAENKYAQPDSLEIGNWYTLKNYNLNTKLQFIQKVSYGVEDNPIYVFLTEDTKAKAYTKEQLGGSNYRLEAIIEEEVE